MKHSVYLAAVCAIICNSATGLAADHTLTSPDGRIAVEINDNGGTPSYSVTYDGKTFIMPSHLGLQTNGADLSPGLTIS